MESKNCDVLCTNLLRTLQIFDKLLTEGEGIFCFDVNSNAESSNRHQELRRLMRSLQQYAEKDARLLYVGFLGHFSAGKSSTINTILNNSGVEHSRLTGQHPTDKAVTLITHSCNSNNLIGAYKRGELEVGASNIDAEFLKESVIVDTPGSGDPLVLEEMVRDFLPICDLIVYIFSAAIPLDKTDLPILLKVQKELPFISMRFIVTRADEFRKEIKQPFSSDNYDKPAADRFIGELISRIEASVDSLKVSKENILLIDNITGFNTENLDTFVFNTEFDGSLLSTQLHSHKIDYYHRCTREIKSFFSSYIQQKINDLDLLFSTAKSNHTSFQNSVTIANNRLTESWSKQNQILIQKLSANTDWIANLEECDDISSNILEAEIIKREVDRIRESVRFWANSSADSTCRALEGKFRAFFYGHMADLRSQVVRSQTPDQEHLHPLLIRNPRSDGFFEYDKETPGALSVDLRRIPAKALKIIHDNAELISSNSTRMTSAIEGRRFVMNLRKTIDESIAQLYEMLRGFFDSVHVYRSAIVSLNARQFAERVGLADAMDEVEKAKLPNERQEAWHKSLVERIFSGYQTIFDEAEKKLTRLSEKLNKLKSKAERLNSINISITADKAIDEHFALSDPTKDSKFYEHIQTVVDSFNEASDEHFRNLSKERSDLIEKKRHELKVRLKTIARKRVLHFSTFIFIGFIIGLLGYLVFYLWKEPFNQNWTNVMLAGVGANFITSGIGWISARFSDKSAKSTQDENDNFIQASREITEKLLSNSSAINDFNFIGNLEDSLKTIFSRNWKNVINSVLDEIVAKPLKEPYDTLFELAEDMEACKQEYIQIAKETVSSLSSFYKADEKNLEALSEISAEIREEAILPSFTMFQERMEIFKNKLSELNSLDLAL